MQEQMIDLTVFGLPGGQFPGFAPDHELAELVPEYSPHHVFDTDALRDFLAWVSQPDGDGFYIHGPTGCGKTSMIEQTAARLNWPVRRVNATERMELADLVGDKSLETSESGNGPETGFQYGPLALAMKEGAIFILDEADILNPAVFAALNPVLEGNALVLDRNGGEVIHPDESFRFVVTGNTAGLGDDTGNYVGTAQQNLATMDRFWTVELGYPQHETEKKILTSRFSGKIDPKVMDQMISLATRVRSAFEEGTMSATFSTRTLVRWASMIDRYRRASVDDVVAYTLKRAMAGRLPQHEQEAVFDMKKVIFE
ncbi:AAA family ATPase [Thioalkalivibrio sp. ALMg11]|uniref:AAA family ATPase n=1 Tax=Thioalkalivibrio sp. ALMg11 TaxID=1158165 RepID=UPI000365B445|nr:AAA family ATPase [Thioalkalivibrio sp. ALMg11]